MALDAAKNFAKVQVSAGYDADDTSIVLESGHGARFPTPPFNAVWWNATDYADPSDDPNREIVRITGISTDTLTVTRAQEGTSGSTKNESGKTYLMIAGPTAKLISDIQDAIDAIDFIEGAGGYMDLSDDGVYVVAGSAPVSSDEPGLVVSLEAGDGDGSGSGGDAVLEAGDGGGTDANGGNVNLRPGNKSGTGSAGKVRIVRPGIAQAAALDPSQISGTDKTFTFPNKSGTIAMLDDIPAPAGGGAWELVSYSTGSGASGFTIGSLDLATDLRYKVLFQIENNTTGNNGLDYYLEINGITTSTYNFAGQYWVANPTYSAAGSAAMDTQYARLNLNSLCKVYWGEIDFNLLKFDGSAYRVMWDWVLNCNILTNGSDTIGQTTGSGWQDGQTNLTSFSLKPYSTTGTPSHAWRIWVLKPKTS